MTRGKTQLRPLESAQRLAPTDREMLEATHAAVGQCASLIAARIDGYAEDGAARLAEVMEAVREVQVAVAGLATRHVETGVESAAGGRADLAALNGTLASVADTISRHDRRLSAVTDAVPALSAAVKALRGDARGADAERLRQARGLAWPPVRRHREGARTRAACVLAQRRRHPPSRRPRVLLRPDDRFHDPVL